MTNWKSGRVRTESSIKIAVSSCLLGHLVRYDGSHKLNAWIVEELARHFELVAVCPEVGIGMGTPRKPVQLRDDPANPRVKGIEDPSQDVTEELKDYAGKELHILSNICGYIFKSRSPSCGLADVPVYNSSGDVMGHTAGIYAQSITAAMPDLPVADEAWLQLRDHQNVFVDRVRQYHQLMEKNNVG